MRIYRVTKKEKRISIGTVCIVCLAFIIIITIGQEVRPLYTFFIIALSILVYGTIHLKLKGDIIETDEYIILNRLFRMQYVKKSDINGFDYIDRTHTLKLKLGKQKKEIIYNLRGYENVEELLSELSDISPHNKRITVSGS